MKSMHVTPVLLLTLVLGGMSALQAQVWPVLRPGELCSDQPGPAVATFEDAGLEAAIRAALSVDAEQDLTCSMVSGLTGLTARGAGAGQAAHLRELVAAGKAEAVTVVTAVACLKGQGGQGTGEANA